MSSETNSPALQRIANQIPAGIHFGTSTWTYPGWQGSVYQKPYKNDSQFRKTCLTEYVQYPLFKTVAIDSFFYSPPSEQTLEQYAEQVSDDFIWLQKVWEHITTPVFARHKRHGSLAGSVNENFLNADLFCERVLSPNLKQPFRQHLGPFIFQFPTIAKTVLRPPEFFIRLRDFFAKLPKDLQFAVEIRNPEFLTEEYFSVLNDVGVTHCFNHWQYMPTLRQQMLAAAAANGLTAPFFVCRLLTPSRVSYQEAVKRFQPYSSVKAPIPEMRTDVVRIASRAIKRSIPAFVIVNNRSEGHAPGTIKAIAEALIASR